MSYMVGGSDQAVERCLPLFQTSGRSIARTGPSGSGIRAELAHQLIVCLIHTWLMSSAVSISSLSKILFFLARRSPSDSCRSTCS